MEPVYIKTQKNGILKERIEQAIQKLLACDLCPRLCHVNRVDGQLGQCRTGKYAVLASYNAHFGEEAPLVGKHGSGTIFFSFCNLNCVFCQNYDISYHGEGTLVTKEQLAKVMIHLQSMGCHNINFVTPSHVVPQILEALDIAIGMGLHVPLVYNSGGYDSVDTLKLLDGIIDIYMPDFKFWDSNVSKQFCNASDYSSKACQALQEMHRQSGDLICNQEGLAYRGILLRHLVLPEKQAGTKQVMRFIASNISTQTYVNIMPQYRPCGRSHEFKTLQRHITEEEFKSAIQEAEEEGIVRFDQHRRVFFVY